MRFTKKAAIEQIQARADSQQKVGKFDLNNGTAQLLPRGAGAKLEALVERAVSYGRMRALEDVARDIECGYLGVAVQ